MISLIIQAFFQANMSEQEKMTKIYDLPNAKTKPKFLYRKRAFF